MKMGTHFEFKKFNLDSRFRENDGHDTFIYVGFDLHPFFKLSSADKIR
jgi:hypothetical protein